MLDHAVGAEATRGVESGAAADRLVVGEPGEGRERKNTRLGHQRASGRARVVVADCGVVIEVTLFEVHELTVGRRLDADQVVVGTRKRPHELVQLELHRCLFAPLGVLQHEHHRDSYPGAQRPEGELQVLVEVRSR